MIAVCFQCGSPKSGPMTKCEFCQKKPVHHRDRVVSMALSNECLSEKNLKIGSQYIKEKKRIPKFHKKVALKAAQLMESYIEVDDGRNSDSIDPMRTTGHSTRPDTSAKSDGSLTSS